MVPRLLLQRWQEILTMVGKSGTKLPRLVEKAIGWRWSDAVSFLASALGKNNLCLKNFKLKAETKIFSLEAMQNYTKMLGILSQLCVLLMALTYCILLSTCTLCARLLSPILWDDQEDGAGSSFSQLSSLPPLRFTSNRWKHPPETSAVSISISSGN